MSFSNKLTKLFERETKPDGRRYTNDDIQQLTGNQITASYISRLRNGQLSNPSYDKIVLIAEAFNVSPAYFFEPDNTARNILELRTPLHTILGYFPIWRRLFPILREGQLSQQLLEDVDEVESELYRLLKLFHELLDGPELERKEIKEQLGQIIEDENKRIR